MLTNSVPNVALEDESCFPCWKSMPDHALLHIFRYLDAASLHKAGLSCKGWLAVAFDELLWKDLFYRHWQISRSIPMAPGKYSWVQEYKRLLYHTPLVESEVLKQHVDEVLHVSFSHNGKMFATCSKDGFLMVWDFNYPTSMKYKADMRKFTWSYTQFSQFNATDTLLLVCGVLIDSISTSGEIAVFSLEGEFVMQRRVMNEPFDVFGTWYNDCYLLSGNQQKIGPFNSCSQIWLNKAYQETNFEEDLVRMKLFKFSNINDYHVIRTIMVAKCLNEEEEVVSLNEMQLTEADSTLSKKNNHKLVGDKYLIFTQGSKTYAAHQIGIKRIKPVKGFNEDVSRLLPNVAEKTQNNHNTDQGPAQGESYDDVDHLIDMHGQIIGMALSSDQRYLYVNSRPWPKNYEIDNLYPPPIAQEIDMHVIDLLRMSEVGIMHRSHKAYTPPDECFFIFLDVCEEYVASGAEDKHGYLWDRHYGLCLHKYLHSDVVNAVSFNPSDPEVLVTVSDDFSIKIWRSHNREKEVLKAFNKEHGMRLEHVQAKLDDIEEFIETDLPENAEEVQHRNL